MSKLKDSLLKQLKSEFHKEAEDCLKIYDKLLELEGGVYGFKWNILVDVKVEGSYPHNHIHFPSEIGKIFLAGIKE